MKITCYFTCNALVWRGRPTGVRWTFDVSYKRGSTPGLVAVAIAVYLHENKVLTINEYKQIYEINHANKVLYEVETYKTRTLFTD